MVLCWLARCSATLLLSISAATSTAATAITADMLASTLKHVENSPRPRSWPTTPEIAAIESALRTGNRATAFERLEKSVASETARLGIALLSAKGIAPKGVLAQKSQIDFETRQAQSAAFVWLISGNENARNEARSRILSLAALDINGPSSVVIDMLSSRHILWTLALALDWMPDEFSASEKALLVNNISARMEQFLGYLSLGPNTFEKWPWDSRANEVLGALAETSLLMLGETTRAPVWAKRFIPLYLNTTMVWAGADGGFASGTTYAGWDIGEYSLRHWDNLRRIAGIDLTEKSWIKNFGRFLTYFVPPGTPTGLFGDGAEEVMPEVWARYAKAYSARVPLPLHSWYARQWFQEDATALELITAPVANFDTINLPPGTPNAAVFYSIGWAALHSDLQNRGRTSIYFKSSPYGSLNHSHADQNSFVLHVGGKVLLADSGYYDSYDSPHQIQWSRRTEAHNAITYDGGQGQRIHDKTASGKLLNFSTSSAVDHVTGDATAAYGPGTQLALRAIAYVRPDLLLIFDSLKSNSPRRWEINLHASQPFVPGADKEWIVINGTSRACIQTMATQPLTFHQWRGFPQAPLRNAKQLRPDQTHGRYTANVASPHFTAVQAIQIDCAGTKPSISFSADGGASVTVGSHIYNFDSNGNFR